MYGKVAGDRKVWSAEKVCQETGKQENEQEVEKEWKWFWSGESWGGGTGRTGSSKKVPSCLGLLVFMKRECENKVLVKVKLSMDSFDTLCSPTWWTKQTSPAWTRDIVQSWASKASDTDCRAPLCYRALSWFIMCHWLLSRHVRCATCF